MASLFICVLTFLFCLEISQRRRFDDPSSSGGSSSCAVHVDVTRSPISEIAPFAGVSADAEPNMVIVKDLVSSWSGKTR